MKDKKVYYIISIIANIFICVGGAWTILIGMFCMFGSLFSKPNAKDFITGLVIYISTYLIAYLINFIAYKSVKKRYNLTFRYFLIPSICVSFIGFIYTILLLL